MRLFSCPSSSWAKFSSKTHFDNKVLYNIKYLVYLVHNMIDFQKDTNLYVPSIKMQ